jgi:hypothetical protein
MFRALPGITALNSTSTMWGGLTFGQLIESSYGGYVLNDNANGYDLQSNPKGEYYFGGNGNTSAVPFAAGVQTPGVLQVPVQLHHCPRQSDGNLVEYEIFQMRYLPMLFLCIFRRPLFRTPLDCR